MDELNNWNQLFDKSKATKVPAKFPGNANDLLLELEDVNDEITDEVEEKGSSTLQQPLLRETTTEPVPRFTASKHQNGTVTTFTKTAAKNKIQTEKQFFKKPIDLGFSPDKKELHHGKDETKQQKCSCHKKQEEKRSETPRHRVKKTVDQQPTRSENVNEKNEPDDPCSSSSSEGDKEVGRKLEDEICNKELTTPQNLTEKVKEGTEETEQQKWNVRPMSLQMAKDLKMLLFGSSSSQFTLEWQKQNIRLNRANHYALRYHKGTTERVMACLQSHVLKHVLFDEMGNGASPIEVAAYHKKSVILAIVDILWQAGRKENAAVCLPTAKDHQNIRMDMKQDSLMEKLEIFEFTDKEDLQKFVTCNMKYFEDEDKFGCILFIYSVIISRTTEKVRRDLSDPNECLIGQLDNGNQSLINLLLVGKATPHLFNNTKEVTDHAGNVTTVHGIKKRSEIGFLSYEEVEDPKRYFVGSMLKTPLYPIWVIFSNDRTCVLFCKKRNLLSDWKLERRFDLFYFAGILRHFALPNEDIRLTIDTMQPFDPNDYDYEFTSSLEETIRTKWQDSLIEWNGSHRF